MPHSSEVTSETYEVGSFTDRIIQHRTEIIDVGGGDSDGQDSRGSPLASRDGKRGKPDIYTDVEPATKRAA